MVRYPNQKIVRINREMPKESKSTKRPYIIAYKDNVEEAMKKITRVSTLKLYLYLIGNLDNYNFALSTQDVADRCGISIDSAQDAVKDLVEKGFLVLREKKKMYDFYEVPQGELKPVEEVKKQFSINKKLVQITFAELLEYCKGDRVAAEDFWRRAK